MHNKVPCNNGTMQDHTRNAALLQACLLPAGFKSAPQCPRLTAGHSKSVFTNPMACTPASLSSMPPPISCSPMPAEALPAEHEFSYEFPHQSSRQVVQVIHLAPRYSASRQLMPNSIDVMHHVLHCGGPGAFGCIWPHREGLEKIHIPAQQQAASRGCLKASAHLGHSHLVPGGSGHLRAPPRPSLLLLLPHHLHGSIVAVSVGWCKENQSRHVNTRGRVLCMVEQGRARGVETVLLTCLFV